MIDIIPAILENEFPEIEKKVHQVSGLVDWVQIDIADNTLVPNTTFLDPEPFLNLAGHGESAEVGHGFFAHLPNSPQPFHGFGSNTVGVLKKHGLPADSSRSRHPLNFELHMMVKDPLRYLERFASVGFKRFFAHVEGDYIDEYIAKCYQLGVEVGLAIDGPTPFDPPSPEASARQAKSLRQYLDNIDAVLVMAIEAGESGRPFREDTVEKIKRIREIDLEIPIAVDGAMNDVNAEKVVAAGATRINSNSFIFGAPDVKMAIEQLKAIKKLKTK